MLENQHPDDPIDTKIALGFALADDPDVLIHREGNLGDRYFAAAGRIAAGMLGDTEKPVVVKDVVHGSSPENLRNDIEFLRFLNEHAPNVAPRLHASNTIKEPWFVQEQLQEGWLGTPGSNFFFNLEELAKTPAEGIFNSVTTLQGLSDEPDLPERVTRQRDQAPTADSSTHVAEHLSQKSGQSFEQTNATYQAAREIRAKQPRVLVHGEVYPQHIFAPSGAETATFIDWENARLGNPYTDHVAVWLRAFENPEWQAAYYELVSGQPGFNETGWLAEVHITAAGNSWYLDSDYSSGEIADRRESAAQYCYELVLQTAEALNGRPNHAPNP